MGVAAVNVRAGGNARTIPQIVRRLAFRDADTVVISEYRDNAVGKQLRELLVRTGYAHLAHTEGHRGNGVCIASSLPFTATVNLPNPLLSWTNQSAAATVTLAQGLQVTWTGGATSSYVIIEGSSSGSNGVSGSYVCFAPTSALQFTVPSYVTLTLPAGTGTTTVENATNPAFFTATGLDYGYGLGFSSTSVNSTYQ